MTKIIHFHESMFKIKVNVVLDYFLDFADFRS